MLVVENTPICAITIPIILKTNIKELFELRYVVSLHTCAFIPNEIIRDISGYVKCMCIK